ncbi:hypothetical protein ABF87_02605, partial [Nitrosomonas sp. JL21]|nr:hypothetical protein [Nitrosomonas sp. JL21]
EIIRPLHISRLPQLAIICLFKFNRWDIADRLQQSAAKLSRPVLCLKHSGESIKISSSIRKNQCAQRRAHWLKSKKLILL